tara:strand:+ start:89 stop:544 length:456 start_codon:yes stop_codon:yes gene_type:complete
MQAVKKRRSTAAEKKLQGTNRADRSQDPKDFDSDIHPPASYLTNDGIEIYYSICKHLKENKGFAGIDHFEISVVANSFSLYAHAANKCKNGGYTQETQTGYSQVKAEYTVMKNESINIMKYAEKYGLNQAAREKILAFSKPKNEADEFSIV